MKKEQISKNVSVNRDKHNHGINRISLIRNLKSFKLWCYLPDYDSLSLVSHELFSRRQLLCKLQEFLSYGDSVSFSRKFFSCFNSDPVYIKYKSNLSYVMKKYQSVPSYLIPICYIRTCLFKKSIYLFVSEI